MIPPVIHSAAYAAGLSLEFDQVDQLLDEQEPGWEE